MSTDPVTSSENQWLKRARRAAERHEDEIVVEGPKQLADALERGLRPIVTLVREGADSPPDCGRLIVVAERAFKSIADTATSQGIVALFERPSIDVEQILSARGPVVALDGVQDPGNVGAIVRVAAAFDVAGVITLPGTADPYSPRAIRGSAGTVLTTSTATTSREQFVNGCRDHDRRVFVAMPSGPSLENGLPRDAVVVLGSEGRGVSNEIESHATPFSIPTSALVESLNVATAAAIVMWEIFRSSRG